MTTQAAPSAANGVAPHVARLPIDEAARMLGISRATVRRRLRSGGLKGVQVSTPHGRKWLVDVVIHLDSPAVRSQWIPKACQTGGMPPAPAREVELLQAHVDDLRRQLEDRTREVGQLHTLLAQAQQRLSDSSRTPTGDSGGHPGESVTPAELTTPPIRGGGSPVVAAVALGVGTERGPRARWPPGQSVRQASPLMITPMRLLETPYSLARPGEVVPPAA